MINKYPQVTFVYNRRNNASPTSRAAVELRITYNGKQKLLSTGVLLYPNQWKKGTITNCPDAIQISQTLDKLLTDIREIFLSMIEENNIDLNTIPDKLQKKRRGVLTLREFFDQRADFETAIRCPITRSTPLQPPVATISRTITTHRPMPKPVPL